MKRIAVLLVAACVLLPTAANADNMLACWKKESLDRLAKVYREHGKLAAILVYATMTDCWLPKPHAPERAGHGVVVARDKGLKDEHGNVATVERKSYPTAPYRGHEFYLAYGGK